MKNLQNKIALITGSSSGVGADIAEELARRGASIIINGRDPQKISSKRYWLQQTHQTQTYACHADGTNDESVRSAIIQIFPTQLDHLDILINNVGGVEKFGSFFDLTDNDWIRAYELNLMSMVRFTRHAIEWLKKSKSPRIINISTVSTRQLGNSNPHYNCAKIAMNYFGKYLAQHLASSEILVNTICPSTMDSGEWEQNIRDRANRQKIYFEEAATLIRQEEAAKSPLRRMNSSQDIAKLTAFLASDENQFISGAIIPLDGAISRTLL